MNNIPPAFLTLHWHAGELLPGHSFRIHDFAVLKSSGQVVMLTDVFRAATCYGYIELDELERGNAIITAFRPCKEGEITHQHEVLREKLIRILLYKGEDYWRKLLEKIDRYSA